MNKWLMLLVLLSVPLVSADWKYIPLYPASESSFSGTGNITVNLINITYQINETRNITNNITTYVNVSDGNYYPTGISFSGASLVMARNGLADLSATLPDNSILLHANNISSPPWLRVDNFAIQNASYFNLFYRLVDAQLQNSSYFATFWRLADAQAQNTSNWAAINAKLDVADQRYNDTSALTVTNARVDWLNYSNILSYGTPTGTYDGLRRGGQNGSYFDEVNDYINISVFQFNQQSITLEAWINPASYLDTATDIYSLVGEEGLNRGAILRLRLVTGKIVAQMNIGNGSTVISLSGITNLIPGNVYHVLGTYNGSHQAIYVNGIADTAPGLVNQYLNSTNVLTIGAYSVSPNQRFFNGSIYQVSVWNRSLSDSEVASEYALGPDSPTNNVNGLVVQYLLNRSEDVFSNSTHVFNVNTTIAPCTELYESTIRYNRFTKKHVGCDGTTWNNLY
jgi:hypothetical protein